MGYRKFLSFLISIVLILPTFFSVSLADTTDGSKSYTTESGITLSLPSDHHQVLWTGMDENDPVLAEMGWTKKQFMNMYSSTGRELQSVVPLSNSAHYLCVLLFETDTPSDLNGKFADNFQMMSPDSYETTEMFGYGTAEKSGIPFYKIANQSVGANVLRLYQYSLFTGSGKMHQINFMLISDPSVTNGKPVPYSDEECNLLYDFSENVMSSIKLSDELASDIVNPKDAEAFKMVTGEDTSATTGNNATSIPSISPVAITDGTAYPLPEGISITLPSEFDEIAWIGMDENDPMIDYIKEFYAEDGLALEGHADPVGKDDGQFFEVTVHIKNASSDINESALVSSMTSNFADAEFLERAEILSQGFVRFGNMELYKIYADMSLNFNFEGHQAKYTVKSYNYSFISESGKLIEIEISLFSDPGNSDDAIPFTDEDLAHLDELEAMIIGSLKFDGKTVSISGAPAVTTPTDGTAYPLPEGLTLTLPSEFVQPLWVGMKEEDSELTKQYGLEPIRQMYENGWILQGNAPAVGVDNGQAFSVMADVHDAPSDVSEATFISNFQAMIDPDDEGSSLEIVEKGVIHAGGIDIYKIFGNVSIDYVSTEGHFKYKIRGYRYSFVTESGKLFNIDISLNTDPYNNDDAIPFTQEDLDHLDYLASYIIGSLQYDGKTVSIQAEAYPTPESNGSGQTTDPAATATPAPESNASKTENRNFFKSFTGFSFPLWILAVVLAVILIAGAKVSKRKEWQEEPFSLSTSKAIQGFSAVAIILHHLSQDLLKDAGPFEFLSGCGVLFVGIFFFFSGYGLYTSLKTKTDYLKGFLKKRLITILIPFYMCIAVFTIASCICGVKYKPLELLSVLSGWSLINTHMWYIVEIAILYLAFFIIYKLIKNRTAATTIMSIFVLAMMGGSLYLCHGKDFSCSYWFMGEWWYNASLLFIIGIIVSKHQDALRKIARKGYVVLLPLFAILTGVFGKVTSRFLEKYSYWSEIPGKDPRYLDKLRCLSVQVPFILCFVFFVLLVMMKVRFGNPVLKFLGAISLELYLIHNLFLTGLSDGTIFKVKSPSMYILLTILMAIGAATIISGADKYLIGLLNGKKKEQQELTSTRNHSIDFMRIVMAFLVVTIHWPFAGKAGNVFITFGKTAVPFFLVVCGYMLYRDDAKELMSRLLKQTRRILIFFVASNLFYAAAVALYDRLTLGKVNMRPYFTGKAIKDFLLFNFSPFSEHLWFFGSLLYALVILLILNKIKILKPAIFMGPVLIAAYVILSHMGVAKDYQLRNAILVGLAYTMTGMLIRRYEKKILSIKGLPVILGILAVGASVAAIIELNTYKKGVAVPFVGCEVLTIVLVLLCLRFPNFGAGTYAEKLGRTCSLPIYIMHIFTMMVFVMTNNDAFFGRYGAVMVFAVTTVAVALYENIKEAVIKTKT